MPIYTYRCAVCGVQFEKTQKFTDEPLTRCPECGKKALHKVYTPVGIVFKGSGFYATDHSSPSGRNSNNHTEEKPPAAKTESTEKAAAPAQSETAKKE